jgi:hypothetical protein
VGLVITVRANEDDFVLLYGTTANHAGVTSAIADKFLSFNSGKPTRILLHRDFTFYLAAPFVVLSYW